MRTHATVQASSNCYTLDPNTIIGMQCNTHASAVLPEKVELAMRVMPEVRDTPRPPADELAALPTNSQLQRGMCIVQEQVRCARHMGHRCILCTLCQGKGPAQELDGCECSQAGA